MRKLLLVQNSAFEEPGFLLVWAKSRKISVEVVKPYLEEPLPALEDFTHLVVLGAPLGVEAVDQFSWLAREAAFLQNCLQARKNILALCFGAQLLAHLLAAEVTAAKEKEIGWHDVDFLLPPEWPDLGSFPLFQWHGDIFSLPQGALGIAVSQATAVQGFLLNENVLALAGHPEMDEHLLEIFLQQFWSEAEKKSAPFIQSPSQMRSEAAQKLREGAPKILALLDAWLAR